METLVLILLMTQLKHSRDYNWKLIKEEGLKYTCDVRGVTTQNLLCMGVKVYWNFVTKNYSPNEKNAVTWEQFVEKFRAEYVPQVEKDRLIQEYLSLK